MPADVVSHAMVGLGPVLCFLAVLLYLDSYKLVSMRAVIAVVACGLVVAGVCYFVNAYLIGIAGIDETAYSRYVSPFVEELGKALVIVVLIRAHRIGFLVDAAIFGFAVGTGFAIVENVYYQHLIPDAGLGIWIVRGFGTAIMHGGTTAIFAMMGLAIREQKQRATLVAFLPGFALAVALHSAFNHMFLSPRLSTLAVIVVLPPMLFWVFQRSERTVADWLGQGFDADSQMLESINSGVFSDSPAGKYLESLKHRFRGPIVADLLCYLRLYTELALRAKGIMMMRENGFDIPVDEETRAKFTELRYLEQSMGKTGMLAIHPMLHMSHKDLWQLYMLGASESRFLGHLAEARKLSRPANR
jgi:RsiW-degrading membrane proteinase PrsW (M82 family)